MPITGASPSVIPTFTVRCINKMLATPYPNILEKMDRCFSATQNIRKINPKYINKNVAEPKKPHS